MNSNLLAAAVFLFVASFPSRAGTIQFLETGVTVSESRMSVLVCPSDYCRVRIDAPPGATFLSTTFRLNSPFNTYHTVLIAEGPGSFFPGTISDAIILYCLTGLPCDSGGQTSVLLHFDSDQYKVWSPEQRQLVPEPCSSEGGCQLIRGWNHTAGRHIYLDRSE